jgi:uncharacterized membrane protein HdeD (DUF308 family)
MQFQVHFPATPDTAALAPGGALIWKLSALRALVAFALCAVAASQPVPELLSWLLATYLLTDACVTLLAGLHMAWLDDDGEGLLLEALAGLITGMAVLLYARQLLALELTALLALWAIFSGLFLLQCAVSSLRCQPGRASMGTAALWSMGWGIVLAARAPDDVAALWLVLAVYGACFGVAMAGLAWRLRRARVAAPD